jgi:hypothetical protein
LRSPSPSAGSVHMSGPSTGRPSRPMVRSGGGASLRGGGDPERGQRRARGQCGDLRPGRLPRPQISPRSDPHRARSEQASRPARHLCGRDRAPSECGRTRTPPQRVRQCGHRLRPGTSEDLAGRAREDAQHLGAGAGSRASRCSRMADASRVPKSGIPVPRRRLTPVWSGQMGFSAGPTRAGG